MIKFKQSGSLMLAQLIFAMIDINFALVGTSLVTAYSHALPDGEEPTTGDSAHTALGGQGPRDGRASPAHAGREGARTSAHHPAARKVCRSFRAHGTHVILFRRDEKHRRQLLDQERETSEQELARRVRLEATEVCLPSRRFSQISQAPLCRLSKNA